MFKRRLTAVALLGLCVAGPLLLAGGCGGSSAPVEACIPGPLPPSVGPMTPTEEMLARDVFDRVNTLRAGQMPPLAAFQWHAMVSGTAGAAQVAYDHSTDMAMRGFVSHISPGCQTLEDRLMAGGVNFTVAAETIVVGLPTPQEVEQMLMTSPEEMARVLSPTFTHLAIGVREGPGGPWWTAIFLELPPQ